MARTLAEFEPHAMSQAMGLPVLHVYYEDLAGSAANLEAFATAMEIVQCVHLRFTPPGF